MTEPTTQPGTQPRETRRVTTVRVKRESTEITIEVGANRALKMGLGLVWRSVLALIHRRRLRLTFRRAAVSEGTRAFAMQIAEERRAGLPPATAAAGGDDPVSDSK